MLYDGVKLVQGSNIQNLVVDVGTEFPTNPEIGELFYRSDAGNLGLYAYNGSTWASVTGAPASGGAAGSAAQIIVVDDVIVNPIPGLGGRGGQTAITGVQASDGGTTSTGMRVLVTEQINGIFNGIYTANDTGIWTRTADWAPASTISSGTAVFNNGWGPARATIYIATVFNQAPTGVVGADPIYFTPVAAASNNSSAQPLSQELSAISSLSGSGWLHKISTGVWELQSTLPSTSSPTPRAARNHIINGDFSVWQTGDGFLTTGQRWQHTADRWRVDFDGDTGGRADLYPVVVRELVNPGHLPEFTNTNLSNIGQYDEAFDCLRLLQSTPLTGNTRFSLGTRLEDIERLQGCTATLSFWARLGPTSGGARTTVPKLRQVFGTYTSVTPVTSGNSSVALTVLPMSPPKTTVTMAPQSAPGNTTPPALPPAVPEPAAQVYPGSGAPSGMEPAARLTFDTSLGNANDRSASLSLQGTGPSQSVSIDVNWGDGSPVEQIRSAGVIAHEYVNHGIYTVVLTAAAQPALLSYGVSGFRSGCLIEVESFGSALGMTDMFRSFSQCYNLTRVPRAIPASITSTSEMFLGCTKLNDPNISMWDTTHIVNMSGMFFGCTGFNQPLSSWNTSNVTNMENMFLGCTLFNRSLNNWNTASVRTMSGMFNSCKAFDQPLNKWNTASVENMAEMFKDAHRFNQDLSSWNVDSILSGARPQFDTGAMSWSAPRPAWVGSSRVPVVISGAPISIDSQYWKKYSVTFQIPSATTPNTVNGFHNGDDYLEVSLSFDGTQQNDLMFTHVQLEAGSTSTAFEHQPRALVLEACRRYLQTSYSTGTPQGATTAAGAFIFNQSTPTAVNTIQLAPEMRSAPEITFFNPVDASASAVQGADQNFANSWIQGAAPDTLWTQLMPTAVNTGTRCFTVYTTGAATDGRTVCMGHWTARDPVL